MGAPVAHTVPRPHQPRTCRRVVLFKRKPREESCCKPLLATPGDWHSRHLEGAFWTGPLIPGMPRFETRIFGWIAVTDPCRVRPLQLNPVVGCSHSRCRHPHAQDL